MSVERTKMIDSLKRIFVPEIKSLRFKGSFPHFRRTENGITNLLTFQFDRNGGAFVIELANHKGEEYEMRWDTIIPLNKLTAHHLYERQRIYPNSENEPNGTNDWFRYDSNKDFDNLAEKAVSRITIMEKYWSECKASS